MNPEEVKAAYDLVHVLLGSGGTGAATLAVAWWLFNRRNNGGTAVKQEYVDREAHDKLDKLVALQTEAITYLKIIAGRID